MAAIDKHPQTNSIPSYAKAETQDVAAMLREIDEGQRGILSMDSEKRTSFLHHAACNYVFTANKLEGTCPIITQAETFKILSTLDTNLEPPTTAFPADGRSMNPDEAKTQVIRHFLALTCLLECKELTPEVLCKAHGLMLSHAVEKDGAPVPAGKFRTWDVSAGFHIFASHTDISSNVEKICSKFEENVKTDQSWLKLSTNLFFDMIQLHPFSNGNGRLCRMLLAYALKRAGIVPFPIQLTSSHTKSRQHYLKAVLNLQDQGKPDFLYYLVLQSVYVATRTFLDEIFRAANLHELRPFEPDFSQ